MEEEKGRGGEEGGNVGGKKRREEESSKRNKNDGIKIGRGNDKMVKELREERKEGRKTTDGEKKRCSGENEVGRKEVENEGRKEKEERGRVAG